MAGFIYNDVDIAAIDTIVKLRRCNQNSHFHELDAGDDTAEATDTV
jgi:hypothetical protein